MSEFEQKKIDCIFDYYNNLKRIIEQSSAHQLLSDKKMKEIRKVAEKFIDTYEDIVI